MSLKRLKRLYLFTLKASSFRDFSLLFVILEYVLGVPVRI